MLHVHVPAQVHICVVLCYITVFVKCVTNKVVFSSCTSARISMLIYGVKSN